EIRSKAFQAALDGNIDQSRYKISLDRVNKCSDDDDVSICKILESPDTPFIEAVRIAINMQNMNLNSPVISAIRRKTHLSFEQVFEALKDISDPELRDAILGFADVRTDNSFSQALQIAPLI